ncbi:hypothetical protein NP233_g2490 [Leucocoprinus birnbaumii]|uniref:ferric-chelate reductase (NADPH) n=1 Tax=Leucocoprinus birnbaumii TaxID=56174 RepID=A0AAD5VY84_9AGAR|nr:hypothetical protein NP233_g2490 [Leucocoprinus birnbaumii]
MSVFHNRASSSAADRLIRDQKQQEKVAQLWIFIGCVLGFLTLTNLLCTLLSYIRERSPARPSLEEHTTDKEKLASGATPNFWMRCVTALTTAYKIFSFRLVVPIGFGGSLLFSEMTFICVYIASLFIWLLVDTRDLFVMFYEDRAAHLASCQLPLIVALAGKNNIISFLTGVGHEKLNILHRAASRTILILLWFHALNRILNGLPPQFDFTHDWVVAGAVGLGALTLAAVLSLGPVRKAAFELFLFSHLILIFVFLVAGFYHARSPGFGNYIWPALMLWVLDRVSRAARVIWNNRLWVMRESTYSSASIELVSSDTIRLTLTRRFRWRPGQHAYIILPSISRLPFEAHPFTIASIPAQSRTGNDTSSGDSTVVFLIRGRTGMTARLRRFAGRENNSTITIPALVDGPYGCPPDLLMYSTSVLIAGGSGVSYTLPLLLNLLRSRSDGSGQVRRIVFLWAIRETEHLEWISKILSDALEPIPPTLSVEPRIYITGSKAPTFPPLSMKPTTPTGQIATTELSSSSSVNNSNPEIVEEEKSTDLPAYSLLKIIHGRPSIRKVLHDEISASTGSVSVDVAGPASLSESVRKALSTGVASPQAAFRGMPSVTLHVEKFGM